MTQHKTAIKTEIIFETFLYWIREEFPLCKNPWIVSDNARCYKNYMFGPIATRIYERYNFVLKEIIHTAAQDGNNMVDANFAIATSHIMRFVN